MVYNDPSVHESWDVGNKEIKRTAIDLESSMLMNDGKERTFVTSEK